LSTIEMLPAIYKRLQLVQIENQDWRKILKRYRTSEFFLYLDPPYVSGTRKSGKYSHEMTNRDHQELVQVCLEYPGSVMLSGYENEIYSPLEKNGWDKVSFKIACRLSNKKSLPRTEVVWRKVRKVKTYLVLKGPLKLKRLKK